MSKYGKDRLHFLRCYYDPQLKNCYMNFLRKTKNIIKFYKPTILHSTAAISAETLSILSPYSSNGFDI